MTEESRKLSSKLWRQRNRDKYNEYQREYVAKKKAKEVATVRLLLAKLQEVLPTEEYDEMLYKLSLL